MLAELEALRGSGSDGAGAEQPRQPEQTQRGPVPTPFPLRPWEKASGRGEEAEPSAPRDAAAPSDAAEPSLPLSHPDSASLAHGGVQWRAAVAPDPTGALTVSVPQPGTGSARGRASGTATPAQLRKEDARLVSAGSLELDVPITGCFS